MRAGQFFGGFRLCGGAWLSSAADAHLAKAVRQVESAEENYLLNTPEDDYVNHLVSAFQIDNVQVYRDKLHAESSEEQVPGELHPFNYAVGRGESYKREVLTFKLP